MASGWHRGPLLVGIVVLAAAMVPIASAAPWSSTFTVAEPRSGDSGLYTPGTIVVDGEPRETDGFGFAFELGNQTTRTDAYGTERNVTPFRSYLVADGEALELPITTWVHARAQAPLARELHLQGFFTGGDTVVRDVDFASRHKSPHGPECLFLTGLQGRTLQEGAQLGVRELCGQKLDSLADEEDASAQVRVAEVADLEGGGKAVRVVLTAEHPDGSLEADLWYKEEIPYPVEINLRGHASDVETEGDASANTTELGRNGFPLLDQLGLLLGDQHRATQGNETSVQASIELERFHRGAGEAVPGGDGPSWPETNRAFDTVDETRWGPTDGDGTFDYPHQEAVQAILEDPTLIEFQAWWEENPEARALASSYDEQTTGQRRSATWSFLVVGDSERAWRLTSQVSEDASGVSAPLTEAPFAGARNDAEEVQVDPSTIDLESVPEELPSLASLVDEWAARDPETSADPEANLFRWTHEDVGPWPHEAPALEVGWRDTGARDPTQPPTGGWSFGESVLRVHPTDGALLDHQRIQASMEGAWLGSPAGDGVAWPGMDFRGASGEPAALDAPVVTGIATIGTLLLIVLVVAKMGLIPFYSRLSREDLLDHPTRRAVYDALHEDQGLKLREVADEAGCAPSTARYHLRRLKDEDLVAAADGGGGTRWFAVGSLSPDEMAVRAALDVGDSRTVFEALRENPGASLTEIAETVGSSPPATHKIVGRLVDAGLVEKERAGRKVALYPVEDAPNASPAKPDA